MQVDLMEIMCSMYRTQGIQVLLFPSGQTDWSPVDYGFRKKMFDGYDYTTGIHQIEKLISPGIIYQYEDDLKLFYTYLCLPPQLEEQYNAHHLIIGPVLFQPVSKKTFQTLVEKQHVPAESLREFQEFYNRVPLISTYDSWNSTIYFFLSRLCGHSLEVRLIRDREYENFLASYEDYSISVSPEISLKTIEERYAMEELMLQAVSKGDIDHAIEYHHRFKQYKLLPRTPDPIRDQKNLLFTLNTLLRKAVQAGNVHPLHIDNISKQFAIQIEQASTTSQLDTITSTMIRKYCMLVKNYSRRGYSSLVQTCMDYIDFHYMDDLSLDFMAKMCSVSNSYLSSVFKKESGMTLTDYINSTRIRRSLTLLNISSLSIQEIATQCGFSDSNYFTRTFKKFQKQSPKGYRESIRK